MKKTFFFLSLLLVTAWIAGFFIFKIGGLFHSMLVIALLLYIRSFMLQPPAAGMVAESSHY